MEIELNGAEKTALSEADAASAAINEEKDYVPSGEEDEDSSEIDSLLGEYTAEDAAKAEEKTAAKVALKEMLINNGFKLRNVLREERVRGHYTSPFSKENIMSIEDILLEIPTEDLHEVGMVQGRIFMPAHFVQKWIIPTIRARKALDSQGKRLPGGIQTAMLFSIFDQSVLDLTKPRQQLDKDAYAIRAIVTCAEDANLQLIEKMRNGNNGLKEIARASLKQLEQAVQLPPHGDLYSMTAIDYQFYQDRIADAITQYRGHTERDLNDLQLLREQNALQASLIWEQQMQICNMNEAYLRLSDEKERIVLADNRLVHEGMEHISTMMSSLQQSLLQRHETLAASMDPIDGPLIAETIRNLKMGLQELHTRNAQMVMRNEKLNLQLSFMPPEMWQAIVKASQERHDRYEQQRSNPHYLHLSNGEYVFMRREQGDKVADRMQRCATVTSVTDLLEEADTVLEYLKIQNGFVDEPINGDDHIVKDAYSMQEYEDTNDVSTVRTAPDMRGGIPSANAIDTPTVTATPAMRLRMVQNIQQRNESANKRAHDTTVPPGHAVPLSKVPKPNPSSNAAPSQDGMTAQGAQVHVANSYATEPAMDTSHPFAALPRPVVGYNIMRDNDSTSDNTSRKNSRWNSRLQARNNGKGKGKPFKKGKRNPSDPYWNIPEFGKASGDARVVLYTMTDFANQANPFRKRIPAPLQRSNLPGYVVNTPEPAFITARKRQDQVTDQNLMLVYHKALRALYQLGESPGSYYLHDEMKQPRTLRGQVIQYLGNGQEVYELLPEDQKTILGDYWRVLRMRPPRNKFSAEKPHLEYIPNNTYTYYEVKTTLDNVKRLKIKPTRYWNELLVKEVPSDILYSLSDFYPGLPYEANIVRDNETLGLPIYRIYESVYFQDQVPLSTENMPEEDKPRKRVNVDATIANLIDLGALPDGEQSSLEHYMLSVEEILKRYETYLLEWPFLVAQRLLKMQVTRLKNIKHALTEKLNNHPLSSANTAVFGSDLNQGNPPAGYDSIMYSGNAPAPADTTSQSGGMMGNNSQSANRSGQNDPSGGGI